MGLDTIDIEDLVGQFSDDMVSKLSSLALNALMAQAPWLSVARPFFAAIIKDAISFLFREGELLAFTFNTNLITTDQWRDYAEQVERVRKLPEDVSDAEWIKAEEAKNHAFLQLVSLKK